MFVKARHIGKYTELLGENFEIEEGVWIGMFCVLDAINEKIKIGKDSVIADHVGIYTHDTSYRTTLNLPKKVAPIEIGNNVQIGVGSKVLCGVKIGSHTIIGANSVVTKDIPSYVVAAGVPARIVKRLKE